MDIVKRCTFKKQERISSIKSIDYLFENGATIMAYPLRAVYCKTEEAAGYPISILVSVPKKRIRSAVDRNLIKRLIREAYRSNKNSFTFEKDKCYDIAFVYIKNEIDSYQTIEKSVKKVLNIISKTGKKEDVEFI